ncbi:hypothetical protein K490DRAFT_38759 [Saccharata proteae CBS 121410]|uniref:G-patch domain-containing protein n=1 Tax=Saccharata proteae CBS 121410 TaxID=1314787 RepID=A0A6A5YDN8_9PEZI|nr:hypothetical protein K490DRAFT_38759 [Saccharata proteae CBS 121410]
MSASDDDEYEIPLVDQRVFGAGLKRKRVKFVPSSTPASSTATGSKPDGASVSNRYLALVLGNKSESGNEDAEKSESEPEPKPVSTPAESPTICDVCKLPLDPESDSNGKHEASLAHQLSLKHSHPPSHIQRSRKGLAMLEARGWQADDRKGLGKAGEGMLHPIKVKEKNDTLGLGAQTPELKSAPPPKVQRLSGKEFRKQQEREKRKGEQLQHMFYQNDDIQKYLGELDGA